MDEILSKFNLKFEDLTQVERDTFSGWMQSLSQRSISVEKIRDYIQSMREAVSQELIDEPEFNYIFIFKVPNRKQILLKARLKNYLLLEAMLSTPEKAKKAIEQQLAAIVPKGGVK